MDQILSDSQSSRLKIQTKILASLEVGISDLYAICDLRFGVLSVRKVPSLPEIQGISNN